LGNAFYNTDFERKLDDMIKPRQIVFEKLNELGINYDFIEHPAVYTIEELESLNISNKNKIVKNLFLRDDKKKHYILLVLSKDKKVNLKDLRMKINSRPLTFASEDSLNEYLRLNKGSVTPFGILNDDLLRVEVIIDKSLLSYEHIGVHPNENTATVFISPKDLELVITDHGNKFRYVEI
jgi:Ala-tRNA(Pro) deacylase